MDLKDFVADVISQITDGVIQAIDRHDAKKAPGRINPVFQGADGQYDWKSAVQNIEFDISVIVSDKKSADGGGAVKIYIADASTRGSKANERTTTNKIKFTIPVSLPAHAVTPGTEWPGKSGAREMQECKPFDAGQ